MLDETDRQYLERCVELAETALNSGDAPFGSILVSHEGQILFEDRNRTSNGDATRHPEFEIAKWAAQHLSEIERKKAVVYTSGEHCSMCASAHALIGLGKIIYASSTEQLKSWMKEIGVEGGPLKGLSIKEVTNDVEVEGPDEALAERIRRLQHKYHNR